MRLDGSALVAALLLAQLGGSLTVLATWEAPAAPVPATPAASTGLDRPDRRGSGRPGPVAVAAPDPTAVAATGTPAAAAPVPPVVTSPTASPPPRAAPAPPAPQAAASAAAAAAAPAPAPAAPPPSSAPPAPAPARAGAAGSDAADYSARLVAGVNAERQQRGLTPLRADGCAERYAREHAQRMADQARMHHQDLAPVLDGCAASRVAENVGHGQVSAERMVAMWMASDSHRATILDPRLTALGSGAARRDDGRWYACHVFLG